MHSLRNSPLLIAALMKHDDSLLIAALMHNTTQHAADLIPKFADLEVTVPFLVQVLRKCNRNDRQLQ